MQLRNRTVPISALRLSKYNWKRNVTEDDISDLADNIEEVGNLHPIIVRQVGKSGTMYEILAGTRRWKAQRILGVKKVSVRVVKCDDIHAEIISYSENLKIKKPDSKEWSEGVKRLVDLFEKKRRVGMPAKKIFLTKSNTSDTSEFCDTATQNSGPGRPKNNRAQAIKETAKTVGTSERTVRRAIKREEDLIPTAARAFKLGKITQDQADILAAMPKKAQQAQFPAMVKETRAQTRKRRDVEKLHDLDDKTPVVRTMLANIIFECKELKSKVAVVTEVISEEGSDPSGLLNIAHFSQVAETRDALTDLLEILEG